jgi:hypothetical protein
LFLTCSTRSHCGTLAFFRALRGLFTPASCGKRGRVVPSPEYRDSGGRTPVVECSPWFATIYSASTAAGRKPVNHPSTENPVDLPRRNSRPAQRTTGLKIYRLPLLWRDAGRTASISRRPAGNRDPRRRPVPRVRAVAGAGADALRRSLCQPVRLGLARGRTVLPDFGLRDLHDARPMRQLRSVHGQALAAAVPDHARRLAGHLRHRAAGQPPDRRANRCPIAARPDLHRFAMADADRRAGQSRGHLLVALCRDENSTCSRTSSTSPSGAGG